MTHDQESDRQAPPDAMAGPLAAVILAAGEGRRMQSERPKPLHRLCGRPMLMYVLDSLRDTDATRAVIVVGHKGDRVAKALLEHTHALEIEFVEQRVQRGTGDATLVGLVGLPDDEDEGDVLVMPGDAPLLRPETVAALVRHHRRTGAAATLLTSVVEDATGYGRVIRAANGTVERVVEQVDASSDELEIREMNTSIYCFRRSLLAPALRRVQPDNAQGEYYLTDVVAVLSGTGHRVEALVSSEEAETQGVNDRVQLAVAESELRRRTNEELLRSGVTMLDPSSVFVDTTVRVGRDVTLFPGVILQGRTVVGDHTEIGPGTRLVDCQVGEECTIEQTTARSARIGDRCTVGPYADLRPGSYVPSDVATGPFYTSDTVT